jgi:UDP-N-acetyl-D-mannosaminuronic acid dehydrogenase
LRESPAVEITAALAEGGLQVLAVEPHVQALPPSLAGKVQLVSLEAALAAANVVVLLVDHRAFGSLTLAALAGKALIDTRGQLR